MDNSIGGGYVITVIENDWKSIQKQWQFGGWDFISWLKIAHWLLVGDDLKGIKTSDIFGN